MATIILDTDIGSDVDDATALLLLTVLPEANLASVTTVGGQTGVRALLARRLLEHAGCPNVPVAPGWPDPLSSDRFNPWFANGLWFGHEGRGVLSDEEISVSAEAVAPDSAVQQLATVIESSPEPVTVVTIGPCTNLASLLVARPDLVGNIGVHVAMGGNVFGAIEIGGHRLSPQLEYNFNADPEAITRVLEAGPPTILVPAEITYQTGWGWGDVELLRQAGHPALTDLCAMIDIWAPFYAQAIQPSGVPAGQLDWLACHLHDSLTVLAATRPELFTMADVRLDLVEADGILTTRPGASGRFPVRVVTNCDVPVVCAQIRDLLLSLATKHP